MAWVQQGGENNPTKSGLKYKLGDFSLFLHKLEDLKLGERYALIGGLATSAWKKKYLGGPEIESKDLDMRGSAEVAEMMQKELKANFERKHFVSTGITMRQFIIPKDKEKTLVIDLLERVGGIDNPSDKKPQGIIERIPYADGDGRDISVMDPLSIFMAKFSILKDYQEKKKQKTKKYSVKTQEEYSQLLSNDIAQHLETQSKENTAGFFTRNDEEHMKVLAQVIPLYLKDTTKAYEDGIMNRNPAVVAKRLRRELFMNQELLPMLRFDTNQINTACSKCIEALDTKEVGMSF